MITFSPDPESENSRRFETREKGLALSVWSAVTGEELKPEIETVERYFGGSSYTADLRTRERIHDAIQTACRIVSPLMAFAIEPIQSVDSDGTLNLAGGGALPVPDCACNPTARFLAAAIGTLGKELESECRLLATNHHIYQSTLLDAVGTAMLDALDIKIRITIDDERRHRDLFSGVRFAPGLNGYPLDHQKTLFQLVDGLSMDVRMNESFMMEPVKTISFFSLLGCEPSESRHPDKCLRCRIPRCQFRKGPSSNPETQRDMSG